MFPNLTPLIDPYRWELTGGSRTSASSSSPVRELHVRDFSLYAGVLSNFSSPAFFSAPPKFLGNRAASYGGYLNFSFSAHFIQEHRANDSLHVWLVVRNTFSFSFEDKTLQYIMLLILG